MKKQKLFNLNENAVEIICRVKKEKNLSTETAALEYIINEYDEWNDKKIDILADTFLKRFEEKYKNAIVRLRLGTTATDKNVQVMIELLNTIIAYNFSQDVLQPTSTSKTEMLKQAENEVKEKIARYKEVKDNNNRKKGKKE